MVAESQGSLINQTLGMYPSSQDKVLAYGEQAEGTQVNPDPRWCFLSEFVAMGGKQYKGKKAH